MKKILKGTGLALAGLTASPFIAAAGAELVVAATAGAPVWIPMMVIKKKMRLNITEIPETLKKRFEDEKI